MSEYPYAFLNNIVSFEIIDRPIPAILEFFIDLFIKLSKFLYWRFLSLAHKIENINNDSICMREK